jgi:putative MATE family efflux protein
MKTSLMRDFTKYVSLNILGMLGLSCYILADTFFVAKALGATGLAALNFSISIYSLIHGTGLMIGIGGASRYAILKVQQKDALADRTYTTCLKLGILLGVIYALIGVFGAKPLASLLGADLSTLPYTTSYLATILIFSPFFILNNIIIAFVRNDHNPQLSMAAMLIGSFSNIVLDYIFMFPLDMGMFGAAFATGLAPIISLSVLYIHFLKRRNNFKRVKCKHDWLITKGICSTGLSSFITEVASAITLITFNLVILQLEGNLGVASYGVVANLALVGISIFTGISQGIQPLVSKGYGLGDYKVVSKTLRLAITTALVIAIILYTLIYQYSEGIIRVFNNENNVEIAFMAKEGLRIYFLGFLFAGINIIIAMYLSATLRANHAFTISILRGCIIIVPMVILLGLIMKMSGVWLSFVVTEGIVALLAGYLINHKQAITTS